MIEIVVLGEPVAKGRPRFAKATGHTYTPQKTRNFEAALKYAAEQVMGDRPPLEGPLRLEMDVRVPIPKSWPKKRQQAARDGTEWPTKKPDGDNFLKVKDALNLVVWVDDSQIVDLVARKFYTPKGVSPCVRVRVTKVIPKENEDE